MRILFLTRWYPSRDKTYDGVFVREHAKAVRAAGHDVLVVHVPGDSRTGSGLWQMEAETDPALTEGIPTYHVYQRRLPAGRVSRLTAPVRYFLYIWSAVRACQRVRRLGFRPDVIHAHVYTAGVPAAVVGKLFGIPMVVTEHFTGFHEGSLGIGGIWKARIAFGRAALVLPVCDYLRRAIRAHGIRAKFQIVPNAVDTSLFFMNGSIHHERPKRLIFVGSLEPTQQKGFPTLVEALGRLLQHRADWHLDVVGQGPSLADSQRLVTSADLSAFVTFHGAVAKPRLAAMMRDSDLFVLPSRFENLPCVIIEAMASGLPVVSTAVGGIPEMVSDGDGFLVPRDDAPALAEALARGLSDLSAFDRAGISSRAGARFSLASVGGELSTIYDTVVSR